MSCCLLRSLGHDHMGILPGVHLQADGADATLMRGDDMREQLLVARERSCSAVGLAHAAAPAGHLQTGTPSMLLSAPCCPGVRPRPQPTQNTSRTHEQQTASMCSLPTDAVAAGRGGQDTTSRAMLGQAHTCCIFTCSGGPPCAARSSTRTPRAHAGRCHRSERRCSKSA